MRLLHEIAIFQTVKSKVIISLFETVRLSVSISLRNLYNSLNSIKEMIYIQFIHKRHIILKRRITDFSSTPFQGRVHDGMKSTVCIDKR